MIGLPTIVSAPPNCTSATQPLVSCNAPIRDQTNPAGALPTSATIRVHARTRAGSTAEIDAQRYSLNTFQEGISVPPPNCTAERAKFDELKIEYASAQGRWARALEALRGAESTFSGILGVALDAATGPGPIAVPLAFVKKAFQVEQARNTVRDRTHAVAELRILFNEARKALDDCLGLRSKTSPRAEGDCTDEDFGKLLGRAQALKLANPVPATRRIVSAIKAHKRGQAVRAIKQLRAKVAADIKRIKALRKAVKACPQP